jgi:hypothetical protein
MVSSFFFFFRPNGCFCPLPVLFTRFLWYIYFQAMASIQTMGNDPAGRQQLTKTFALCGDSNLDLPLDLANFYSTLADNFDGAKKKTKKKRKKSGRTSQGHASVFLMI